MKEIRLSLADRCQQGQDGIDISPGSTSRVWVLDSIQNPLDEKRGCIVAYNRDKSQGNIQENVQRVGSQETDEERTGLVRSQRIVRLFGAH